MPPLSVSVLCKNRKSNENGLKILSFNDKDKIKSKCASSVFNIGQCLLARTRKVESVTTVVTILREEI
ncbi:hypothetical protein DVH24_013874 [Malus domestica]|uniref:Uncharacterized protein n=1 Tax=Malus domestica TaxID=3750 RepID=A0A498JC37_MALDO|nr:hypothetical protein DVH24_013874 [Malus domestica]